MELIIRCSVNLNMAYLILTSAMQRKKAHINEKLGVSEKKPYL